MKMNMKRLMSLALAGVLSSSMMATAFAVEGNTSTEISGTFQEIEIAVDVPDTGSAFINPYGLPYELDDSAKTPISGMQIMSLPLAITNNSKVDLDVAATVSGSISTKSDMKFSATSTAGVGEEGDEGYVAPLTTKSAYVYLEMAPAGDIKDASAAAKDTWYPKFVDDKTIWTAAKTSEPVVVGTTAATGEALVELKAAAEDATTKVLKPVAGGIAFFRLNGDCVTAPKSAWTEKDTFTVSVAFTFTPA